MLNNYEVQKLWEDTQDLPKEDLVRALRTTSAKQIRQKLFKQHWQKIQTALQK